MSESTIFEPSIDLEYPIFGWLNGNEKPLDMLIRQYNVHSVLEIGTFMGLSARFFASYTQIKQVVCIDKFVEIETHDSYNNLVATLRNEGFPNPYYDVFVENMKRTGAWSKLDVMRMWSHQAAELISDGWQADLIYVDGDHSSEGLTRDIELYLPRARKVICGDDWSPRFPGVTGTVPKLLPNYQVQGALWWSITAQV